MKKFSPQLVLLAELIDFAGVSVLGYTVGRYYSGEEGLLVYFVLGFLLMLVGLALAVYQGWLYYSDVNEKIEVISQALETGEEIFEELYEYEENLEDLAKECGVPFPEKIRKLRQKLESEI